MTGDKRGFCTLYRRQLGCRLEVTTNRNPANQDDVIGTYARGGAARVDEAVAAAMAAKDEWAHASPQLRHDVLERAGALIVERKDELGSCGP